MLSQLSSEQCGLRILVLINFLTKKNWLSVEELLISFLLRMNEMQGIRDIPAEVPSTWISQNTWETEGNRLVFEATSKELPKQCKQNPSSFVKFPIVLYGAHEIFFDNSRSIVFGNPDM